MPMSDKRICWYLLLEKDDFEVRRAIVWPIDLWLSSVNKIYFVHADLSESSLTFAGLEEISFSVVISAGPELFADHFVPAKLGGEDYEY